MPTKEKHAHAITTHARDDTLISYLQKKNEHNKCITFLEELSNSSFVIIERCKITDIFSNTQIFGKKKNFGIQKNEKSHIYYINYILLIIIYIIYKL